jgi:hypothetical protein
MHEPTGFLGVHARPNSGHSGGSIAPRSTSPQRQPTGSTDSGFATSNRFAASNPANSSLSS